jgi:hypothetical protein
MTATTAYNSTLTAGLIISGGSINYGGTALIGTGTLTDCGYVLTGYNNYTGTGGSAGTLTLPGSGAVLAPSYSATTGFSLYGYAGSGSRGSGTIPSGSQTTTMAGSYGYGGTGTLSLWNTADRGWLLTSGSQGLATAPIYGTGTTATLSTVLATSCGGGSFGYAGTGSTGTLSIINTTIRLGSVVGSVTGNNVGAGYNTDPGITKVSSGQAYVILNVSYTGTSNPYAGLTATGTDVWNGKSFAGSGGTATGSLSLVGSQIQNGLTFHAIPGTDVGAGFNTDPGAANVALNTTYMILNVSYTGSYAGGGYTVPQSIVVAPNSYAGGTSIGAFVVPLPPRVYAGDHYGVSGGSVGRLYPGRKDN